MSEDCSNKYSTQMVYGRILYNSIREYTPRFFPTVPFSQTAKPVFGKHRLKQAGNLKWYQSGTLIPWLSEAGDYWAKHSITVGLTRSLCSVFVLDFGPPSSSPASGSISSIIVTAPSKQPW